MRIVNDKEKLTDFVTVSPGQCFVYGGTYYMKITDVTGTYDDVYNTVAISNSASGELCYFDNQVVVSVVNLEARVVE